MIRNLPRFLPTLTEVILPGSVAEPPHASPAVADADQELIIRRVTLRVEALLQARLHQVIDSLVREQAQLLGPRLQKELAPMVREVVAEAMLNDVATK